MFAVVLFKFEFELRISLAICTFNLFRTIWFFPSISKHCTMYEYTTFDIIDTMNLILCAKSKPNQISHQVNKPFLLFILFHFLYLCWSFSSFWLNIFDESPNRRMKESSGNSQNVYTTQGSIFYFLGLCVRWNSTVRNIFNVRKKETDLIN